MNEKIELFAIVSLGSLKILWAAATTKELAEDVAIRAAVTNGNVSLLSGADLGQFLIDNDRTSKEN